MKKVINLVFCTIFIFILSACNSTASPSENSKNAETSSISKVISQEDEKSTVTLESNQIPSGQGDTQTSKYTYSSESSNKTETSSIAETNSQEDEKSTVSQEKSQTSSSHMSFGTSETTSYVSSTEKQCYHISYNGKVNGKLGIFVLKETEIGRNVENPNKGIGFGFEYYSNAVGNVMDDGYTVGDSTPSSEFYDVHIFKVPNSYSVDTETFTIPKLEVAGYTFLGWTYEDQTTPVKTVTIPKGSTKNYNLVANWLS